MIPRLFVPVNKKEILGLLRVQVFKKQQTNYINSLEKEFANYSQCKYVKTVGLGRIALSIILKSLNVKKGDEIILPVFCASIVAKTILSLGAIPHFVDINSDTFNIDCEKIEKNISERTKAILAVHIFGLPCDMNKINKIAKSKNLYVIEDCAQAMGAEYKGQKVGTFGDAAFFSLGRGKNITTVGGGGIITTNNYELYKKISSDIDNLRYPTSLGIIKSLLMLIMYQLLPITPKTPFISSFIDRIVKRPEKLPKNPFRLSNAQAFLAISQLKKIDLFNAMRIYNSALISKGLSKIKGIKNPIVPKDCKHVFLRYPIIIENNEMRKTPMEIVELLRNKGIDAAIMMDDYLTHISPEFNDLGYAKGDFPVAEKTAEKLIALPIHPKVSEKNIGTIVNTMYQCRYVNVSNQSRFTSTIDAVTFPIRALFMGTEGNFGLSSLREERMRIVAKYCEGRVLDVGCGQGNLFIKEFIGEKNGVGIDVFPYEGVTNIVEDMTNMPFKDSSFDTITLIAVGGHIPKPKRKAEFREFSRLLKPGGLLIMTEGEPVTQFLTHKWRHFYCGLQGKLDMDSERGMDEEEQYCMPRAELLSYLNTPPLRFKMRKHFMWGLNNVYVASKYENENGCNNH
jgi:perosamine synthetase